MTSYRDVAEAVRNLLDSGKSAQEVARSTAEYLVEERRTKELDKIMRTLQRLRLERDDTLEVTASSAYPLSDMIMQEITRLYDAKNIKVVTEIDESLVGGVRLRTLDTLVDMSVRGQLSRLKQQVRN